MHAPQRPPDPPAWGAIVTLRTVIRGPTDGTAGRAWWGVGGRSDLSSVGAHRLGDLDGGLRLPPPPVAHRPEAQSGSNSEVDASAPRCPEAQANRTNREGPSRIVGGRM